MPFKNLYIVIWYSRLKKICGNWKNLKIFSRVQTQWNPLQLRTFGKPKIKEYVHKHPTLWYTREVPRYFTSTQAQLILQMAMTLFLLLLAISRYSSSDGQVRLSRQEISIACPRQNSNNISMYNFIPSGWLKLSTFRMDLKYTHIAALIVLATPYTVCAAGIPLRRVELSRISSILQCKVIHKCNTKHLTQYFSLFTNI